MSIFSNKWRLTRGDPDIDSFLSRSSRYLKVDSFLHEHHGTFDRFLDQHFMDFINGNRLAADFVDGVIKKMQGWSSYDLRDSVTLTPQPGLKLTYLVRLVKLAAAFPFSFSTPPPTGGWRFYYVVVAGVTQRAPWSPDVLRDISRHLVSKESDPYDIIEGEQKEKGDDHYWTEIFKKIGEWQADWETGEVTKREMVEEISEFVGEFPPHLREECIEYSLSLVGDLEALDDDDEFEGGGKSEDEEEEQGAEEAALIRRRKNKSSNEHSEVKKDVEALRKKMGGFQRTE